MASRLQLRRGTKTEHESFTGQVGETTVDTTNDDLRVHDGSTVGGKSVAQGNKYDGIKQLDNAHLKDRAHYDVAGFYAGTEVGGGQFIYDASRPKSDNNGKDIFSPEAIAAWDGTETNISVLEDWTGTGTGCFVFVSRNKSYKNVAETYPVINVPEGETHHFVEGQNRGNIQFQRIIGAGVNSATPTYGVRSDTNSGAARNQNMEGLYITDMSGAGVSWSSGWSNVLRNSRIQSCQIGLDSVETGFVENYSWSNFLSESNYYAVGNSAGRIALNLPYSRCFTSINDVIESSFDPIVQNSNGRTDVFINTWLEANTNAPKIRRSTVTIGGYGWDYSDLSFFDAATALINIGHNSKIQVIGNGGESFNVDGESVKALKLDKTAIGFTIEDSPLGGTELDFFGQRGGLYSYIDSAPAASVPVVSLSGLGNFYGSFPTTQAAGERAAVDIGTYSSSANNGSGGGVVRFKTFRYSYANDVETAGYRWEIDTNGHFIPVTDNAYDIGAGPLRPRQIYAANGTINTSDARLKTQAMADELDSAIKAWSKVRGHAWKWLSAIEEKGADARIHIGPYAQDIIAAFESEGIDPFAYGLICKDFEYKNIEEDTEVPRTRKVPYEVEEVEQRPLEDGTVEDVTVVKTKYREEEYMETVKGMRQVEVLDSAGQHSYIYSIRPVECLFLEMEYSRKRFDTIEQRLDAANL